jgi:hypothetical protein
MTRHHPVMPSSDDVETHDDDRIYTTRSNSSSIRYQQTGQRTLTKPQPRDVVVYKGEVYYKGPSPLRQRQQPAPDTTPGQPTKPSPRYHWLLYAGTVMLVMIAGWVVFSSFFGWGATALDDWHYGRPRTFQCDVVVGHNDSAAHPTHVIAVNLRNEIQIIELPGGEASRAKTYIVPIGPGQALTPVTLTFRDVTGDGKPDMLITFGSAEVVFLNDHGAFRPLRPGESIRL